METEKIQQIAKEEEPKEEITQVTKNPKRVEAGKKGAAARKAKQESLLNMVHKKKAELTPQDYKEPVIGKVHKTTSNTTYFMAGIGLIAGAFLGWRLLWQSKMPTVNDMKPMVNDMKPTSKVPTVSVVPNAHYME